MNRELTAAPLMAPCTGTACAAAFWAERFIRTLKENLLWVRDFATVEDLRLALLEFRRRYNETWILERHGYQTPAAIRAIQTQVAALAA